jgi:hypothetical protein
MCLSRPWRAKHVVNERDGCVGKVVRQADGKWCVKQINGHFNVKHIILFVAFVAATPVLVLVVFVGVPIQPPHCVQCPDTR